MFAFLRGVFWGALLIGAVGLLVRPIRRRRRGRRHSSSDRMSSSRSSISARPACSVWRSSLTGEEFSKLTQDAAHLASASGQAVAVERFTDDEQHVDSDQSAPTPVAPASKAPGNSSSTPTCGAGTGGFETALSLCPGMTVSNAPTADAQRHVKDFRSIVSVDGVPLAINPTHGACLSSGFGARNGRPHEGIDFYSADGGPIEAAANGVVIEKKYRDDYGNMLLIDHGKGVYTRYAPPFEFRAGRGNRRESHRGAADWPDGQHGRLSHPGASALRAAARRLQQSEGLVWIEA